MVELIQPAPILKLQMFFARCLQSLLIMAQNSAIFYNFI
ncbi:hypothetical protein L313_3018 [Acinetobacter haemolyticus CIP 64.3 = MTCC 9819]|nr:hypothetical protein L313_3018 [Acinetobacter haemolyticus CIP 64.3 = MTCC 9819]